jgi:hypothetical protein
LIVIKSNCKRSANKSSHQIQNPLLIVTEPQTRDNTLLKLNSVAVVRKRPLLVGEVSANTLRLKKNIAVGNLCVILAMKQSRTSSFEQMHEAYISVGWIHGPSYVLLLLWLFFKNLALKYKFCLR